MIRKEIFISVDVEADGPIPGTYSMLSLGAVAINEDGVVLGEFEVNLNRLPYAREDAKTMKFWDEFPEAYQATRVNTVDPKIGMERFVTWFEQFQNPVFVFFPAKFDAPMVYWYLINFVERMDFMTTPDMYDIKTFAAATLKSTIYDASKAKWPKRWKNNKRRHTHVAVEDAAEQGEQFIKIRNERMSQSDNDGSSFEQSLISI